MLRSCVRSSVVKGAGRDLARPQRRTITMTASFLVVRSRANRYS